MSNKKHIANQRSFERFPGCHPQTGNTAPNPYASPLAKHAVWHYMASIPVYRYSNFGTPMYSHTLTSEPYRRETPKPLGKKARWKWVQAALARLDKREYGIYGGIAPDFEIVRDHGNVKQRRQFNKIAKRLDADVRLPLESYNDTNSKGGTYRRVINL